MSWHVYTGTSINDQTREAWLADAPPWRRASDVKPCTRATHTMSWEPADRRRAETYRVTGGLDHINAALLLRRPLLVTGAPGLGKSTLAYSIAHTLGLGPVLRWEINSRTTLADGIAAYDAVGHLRDAQAGVQAELGNYITLGPLGTALIPTPRPRVLLVDELDKASYDLPNDLLHVLEERSYQVPELARGSQVEQVLPCDWQDSNDRVDVVRGRVLARHAPVVVITSNGEREFPPAFLRRCVGVELTRPDRATFARIVRAAFGDTMDEKLDALYEASSEHGTDELLQALHLSNTAGLTADDALALVERIR